MSKSNRRLDPGVRRGAKPACEAKAVSKDGFQSTPLVVEGRCLRGSTGSAYSCRFQSTPLVVEGRCPFAHGAYGTLKEFQSTPLVVEGRCNPRTRSASRCCCFNPRPSLSRGDADVFLRRATELDMFQSTPLVVEGRCASPVTREFHEEKGPCCANLLEKCSANHTECGDCRWKCFCINRLRRPRTCRGSAGTCGSRALFRQPAVHQNLSP